MNLQQLRYLVATADQGTMTGAARACHVAQPALTRAVRALEQELGLELLARSGRGVRLTDDGRVVVETARRVLAEVAIIEGLGRRTPVGDTLAIAATPTIQADLGSGLISEFWERHPQYPVRFVSCESRQLVGEAVLGGDANVGVTDLPAGEGLVVVEFESREVIVMVPPGSGLPEPLPVRMLGELPLILPTKGSLRRAAFDVMFAELGIDPPVAFESDERASWTPAVLAGVGCCIWYRRQGDVGGAFGAEVRSLQPALHRPIGVVHRPGETSPAVAALTTLAEERAAAARS